MMPELGKYAGAVMWSYTASVALIVGLVVVSIWRAARVKRQLSEVEARQGKAHD